MIEEKQQAKMEDIEYFRVTSRDAKKIMYFVNLDEKNIDNLPTNAVVVEVGSGWMQELAQYIKSFRPDLEMISMDPTLSIASVGVPQLDTFHSENTMMWPIKKDDKVIGAEYILKSPASSPDSSYASKAEFEKIQNERLIAASKNVGLAALAPEFPFANNSIDLIIDSFGPALYLSDEDLKTYITSARRILKMNGELRIFPLDSYSHLSEGKYHNDDEMLIHSKVRVEKALEGNSNLQAEFFEKDDTASGQKRLGVVVKKVA